MEKNENIFHKCTYDCILLNFVNKSVTKNFTLYNLDYAYVTNEMLFGSLIFCKNLFNLNFFVEKNC